MSIPFMHSPLGRVFRIVLGAAIVLYAANFEWVPSLLVLTVGTSMAILAIADVRIFERLGHLLRSRTSEAPIQEKHA